MFFKTETNNGEVSNMVRAKCWIKEGKTQLTFSSVAVISEPMMQVNYFGISMYLYVLK